MREFQTKYARLLNLLDQYELDGILLQRVSSFAWATCGAASYVNTAASEGASSLLVTRSTLKLFTTNIESTRLANEERLALQGWDLRISPWIKYPEEMYKFLQKMKLGSDIHQSGMTDLSGEITRLRSRLTPEESERFRMVGRLCATAMDAAIHSVRPGMTEHEIAGRLALEADYRGLQAIVNLVATDERIFAFRHPLPTTKKLERYAMLVLCGRRGGLVCSLTRLVHFGTLPDEIKEKSERVAQIDAVLIDSTRAGSTLGEVLERGIEAYRENGYPEEWKNHHQGGPAGYEPREMIAIPGMNEIIRLNQAFAWNPSITGTKSEDSIVVGGEENEIVTKISGWPIIRIGLKDRFIERPQILEIT